jgi:RNA polymerase sigma-70 factor, ECF subfamily
VSEESALSFEDLAEELSQPLFAYLKRMVGNSADADDLLQETLMRIAHGLPQFEQRSNAKTWAFRIATNVAIDFLRKSKKARFAEFSETDNCPDFDEDDRLVLDEMNECIRGVIDSLPPDYRAAIVLYNLQGKSVSETAKICGISISTAKIRIHRAKTRLKEALNKECDFYKSAKGDIRCDRKQPE